MPHDYFLRLPSCDDLDLQKRNKCTDDNGGKGSADLDTSTSVWCDWRAGGLRTGLGGDDASSSWTSGTVTTKGGGGSNGRWSTGGKTDGWGSVDSCGNEADNRDSEDGLDGSGGCAGWDGRTVAVSGWDGSNG